MVKITPSLQFVLQLARAQAILNRKLDGQLSMYELSFNDFVILYHLMQAKGEKMRRIDLAEKIGVTASAITRILAPMEKIGLVAREHNEHDARISYVVIAPGGRRLFRESLQTAEFIAEEIFAASKIKKTGKLAQALNDLTGII